MGRAAAGLWLYPQARDKTELWWEHKLAIRPSSGGKGIGLEMLKWAEAQAKSAGKRFLRLNCLAEDRKIRDYYERAGFVYRGDVVEPRGRASLYEKRLSP